MTEIPEDWALPTFETLILGPRAHDICLVIPVINEGERIQLQLAELSALHLPIDVIIADGGSTDGSVDEDILTRLGVRTRLTKTGAGKLSAQLRMAYGWALAERYTGIVTVDGNGKDGQAAVADFIAALEAGYDYVQGSRYAPGGAAINTPLSRWIAGRFIHAPVISLAARHWLTDTTNGFRAYSAGFLTDPRVQPFRDIFMVYNLLFYLSIRAGRLGFRVKELPVRRAYPDSGKVPTKIKGFGGKFDLLGELFAAALGRYNPPG